MTLIRRNSPLLSGWWSEGYVGSDGGGSFRGFLARSSAAVKDAVDLPVLRKDFIFDEYQVYETAVAGADALLLIVAALTDGQLVELRATAEEELGLDALVEVHDEGEMERAIAAGSKLIGVNNRNLRTFEVSLETSVKLASAAPKGITLVSESGLKSAQDLQRLRALGFGAFLIGESLMIAEDPELALRSLITGHEA